MYFLAKICTIYETFALSLQYNNQIRDTMKTKKYFPNGIHSYLETFYEAAAYLTHTADEPGSMSNDMSESNGTTGLYTLAEQLADEFEKKNKNRLWDGEFFDEIEKFLNEKEPREYKAKKRFAALR